MKCKALFGKVGDFVDRSYAYSRGEYRKYRIKKSKSYLEKNKEVKK